ncbi:Vam6/Vps39-like protein [Rhizophlyctis rosea]|nr:Vam6/Vps39-like protein [Rhizophlyctis rosea]
MGQYEEYPNVTDTLYLMEIVDTTLLKVYLQVNKSLVGPLVRVQNHCNLEESEKVLLENQRYLDLVDLYRGKGLHGKALEFLQSRASSSDAMYEFDKMILYMQGLNFDEHIDLLLKYAEWVIKRDAAGGMKVFTEHYDETSIATRHKIASHLENLSPDFAITYLEHLIDEQGDVTPDFHDQLIFCYLKVLARDIQEHVGYAGPMLPRRPGGSMYFHDDQNDKGQSFWKTRRKLGPFLDQSKVYHADRVLEAFPPDGLFEERAAVLSRLNRHEEALRIYTEKLRNYQLANMYCEKHYEPQNPYSADVFLILLTIYLELMRSGQLDMSVIITFLTIYGPSINGPKVLELLPATVRLSDLVGYFERTLHDMHRKRNMDDVVKNLLKADQVQAQERLAYYQSRRIVITEERMCSKCLKRISNTVFTVLPSGVVMHAFCALKK